MPLSGGPFNWVAIFAPPSCKKFLSYLAGWLSVISYIALVAATCFITGGLIESTIQIQVPTYEPENWHGTLFFYAVLAISLFVNVWLGRILPQIESLLLFVHILGFIGIIIPILYLGEHQPAEVVFETYSDGGGWGNYGLAGLVGSVTVTNAFCGMDGADHIGMVPLQWSSMVANYVSAEELRDAARSIPTAIGSSLLLNGCLGLAMLLALLYCMPPGLDQLIASIWLVGGQCPRGSQMLESEH